MNWPVVHVGPGDAIEFRNGVMFGRVEAVEADAAFGGFAPDSVDVVPGAGVIDVALGLAA